MRIRLKKKIFRFRIKKNGESKLEKLLNINKESKTTYK